MKILITGSNGLLGQKLLTLLRNNASIFFDQQQVEIIGCSRGENRLPELEGFRYISLDLTNRIDVQKTVDDISPDCIIHTAAMTNVDACELNPEECEKQNVEATANLVYAIQNLERVGGKRIHLIHLSTDFVFDGLHGPYRETDLPGPLSIYGQSKLDAEHIVLNSDIHFAIVRTIIVYGVTKGMSRSNIVLWVAESLKAGKDIQVVTDQFRSPTLAEDLACGCLLIASKGCSGIYHISGPDTHSIIELAYIVCDIYGLPKDRIIPLESLTLNQAARRPARTGFIIDKARKDLGYCPMDFRQGVAFVKAQTEGKNPVYVPVIKPA